MHLSEVTTKLRNECSANLGVPPMFVSIKRYVTCIGCKVTYNSVEVVEVEHVHESVDEHTEVISRQALNVGHGGHGRQRDE